MNSQKLKIITTKLPIAIMMRTTVHITTDYMENTMVEELLPLEQVPGVSAGSGVCVSLLFAAFSV